MQKRGSDHISDFLNAAVGMNAYVEGISIMIDAVVAFVEPSYGLHGVEVYVIERYPKRRFHDDDLDAPPHRIGVHGMICAEDGSERWVHKLDPISKSLKKWE